MSRWYLFCPSPCTYTFQPFRLSASQLSSLLPLASAQQYSGFHPTSPLKATLSIPYHSVPTSSSSTCVPGTRIKSESSSLPSSSNTHLHRSTGRSLQIRWAMALQLKLLGLFYLSLSLSLNVFWRSGRSLLSPPSVYLSSLLFDFSVL